MKRNITRWIMVLVATCCCMSGLSQENNPLNEDQEKLQKDLEKIGKKKDLRGFGVAVVDEQGIIYSRGFGFADVQKQLAYSTQTIQSAASVSKTLLAIALLKAQEEGKLQLTDPVNKYLPFEINNPYHPINRITINHLATHTSTITDTEYYNKSAYVVVDPSFLNMPVLKEVGITLQHPDQQESIEGLIRKLYSIDGDWYRNNNFLDQQPGKKFAYSNMGAALAAYILEQVTGMPYHQYTSEHILKPLGMTASGWNLEQINIDQQAVLYADANNPLPGYSLVTYPDGGLLTSIEDLSKFLMELISGARGQGTLLKPESYQLLFKPQLTATQLPKDDGTDPLNDQHNRGVFIGYTASGMIGHKGADPGVSSFLFFNPTSGVGKIFLANTTVSSKESVKQYNGVVKALDKYMSTLTSNQISDN